MLAPVGAAASGMSATRRLVHKTIAVVGEDLEQFRFNRAVARLRELSNHLEEVVQGLDGAELREALEALVVMFGPMMPHLCETLWHGLGHATLLVDQPWPTFDPALARDDEVTLAVQVNGRLRGTVTLPADSAEEAARTAALALPAVARALEGRSPRKLIVVPNRLVNVVG
jgi:leucyl-tRNA synthetase